MNTTHDKSRQDAIERLRELIHDIPVAMLTTAAADGSLNSRPMVNVNDKFDGTLWFFTKRDDPKVGEVGANSQVNACFAAPSQHRYVSAAGRAGLVLDAKHCELMWKPDCETYFPKGPKDPDLGLLKVDVESAAYWDQQQGAMVSIAGFLRKLVGGDAAADVDSERIDWANTTAK